MAYYPFAAEAGAHYKLFSRETNVTATFNNPFAPNYAGMLAEVTGLDSPEVREQAEDLVESDGGRHGTFYFGRRPVTMTGRVFGHTSITERSRRLDLIRRASQALRKDAVLSWVPSQRRTNVVHNPRFTSAAGGSFAGWTQLNGSGVTGSGTNVISGAGAPGGTQTARETTMVATGAGQSQSLYASPWGYADPDGVMRYPGELELGGMGLRVAIQAAYQLISTTTPATPPQARLQVRCFDSNNAYIGGYIAQTKTITVGGWNVLAASIPIESLPGGTARVTVEPVLMSAAAGTNVWRVTNIGLDQRYDSTIPNFIDGGSGGYWWGAENNSASGDYIPMQIDLRRNQPYREQGAWVKEFQLAMVAANPLITSPVAKTITMSLGSSVFGENQGSGAYYPSVVISFPSAGNGYDDGAKLRTGTTGLVFAGAVTGAGTGNDDVILDTLEHTFYREIPGPALEKQNHMIDWAATTVWPSSGPGGSTWTFENGPGAAYTGAVATVYLRDAWM